MPFPFLLLALPILSALPIAPQDQTTTRGPHCTFAEEDLPLVLALGDLGRFECLRVAPGVELERRRAARFLWDRHRQGHGGWPDEKATGMLAELGLGEC